MAEPDYSAITSCLEVDERQFERALAAARSFSDCSPRQKSFALIKRMAEVARPNAGAPRMLALLARMAKRDWLEGELSVKLIGDAELSVLELLVDDGATVERVLGPLRVDVPLQEFIAEVQVNRVLLAPLQVRECSARRIVLRGMPDHKLQARKASISAFAVELVRGVSGSTSAPSPTHESPADRPRRRPPPPPRKPR